MTQYIKKFIEENTDLIENEDYITLFQKHIKQGRGSVGELIQVLTKAGIYKPFIDYEAEIAEAIEDNIAQLFFTDTEAVARQLFKYIPLNSINKVAVKTLGLELYTAPKSLLQNADTYRGKSFLIKLPQLPVKSMIEDINRNFDLHTSVTESEIKKVTVI